MSERNVTVTARLSYRDLERMAQAPCSALKMTDQRRSILVRDRRMAIELARHSARVLAHIAREEGHDSTIS